VRAREREKDRPYLEKFGRKEFLRAKWGAKRKRPPIQRIAMRGTRGRRAEVVEENNVHRQNWKGDAANA